MAAKRFPSELRLDFSEVPLDSMKLRNFPVTGPMFSGPQQTPFVCRTNQVGRQPLIDSASPPGYAVYDAQDGNYVRPLGMVNFPYEIYQQNDKYVWCWMPDVDATQMKAEVTATTHRTESGVRRLMMAPGVGVD